MKSKKKKNISAKPPVESDAAGSSVQHGREMEKLAHTGRSYYVLRAKKAFNFQCQQVYSRHKQPTDHMTHTGPALTLSFLHSKTEKYKHCIVKKNNKHI